MPRATVIQSIVLGKAGVSGLCKHVCAVDLPVLQFRDLFGLIISIGTVVAVNAAKCSSSPYFCYANCKLCEAVTVVSRCIWKALLLANIQVG